MTNKPLALRVDRLAAARKSMGWSQRELARRCGFSDAQIRSYEVGANDPTGYSLKMLAEQLNLSTDYLLGITDDPRGHFGDDSLSSDDATVLATFRREGWSGLARLSVENLSK
jgi:transcriptional regulator with XRE-family HTH domain